MVNRQTTKSLQKVLQAGVISLSMAVFSCDRGASESSSSGGTIGGSGNGRGGGNETDKFAIIDTNRFVDPMIRPYLDSFIQELENRQISANLSNITMVFVDDFGPGLTGISEGGNIAGVCYRSTGLVQLDHFFINDP